MIGLFVAHRRFSEKTAHEAPGILITIGIFATFFGIALGLYSFNVNDVEKSLPELINGIKIAFWASVVGVGAALTLKIRYALFGVGYKDEETSEGATIDDLVVHLKHSAQSLDRLQRSIVGEEDSSMLTQLKLIRSDQNDRLDALRNAFNEFAKTQAENNSKALIEALKEVIRDFNQKIHEQFGENFRHLNEAVGKINDWQEKYRQQMSEMIEQQKQTAADMRVAVEAFSKIVLASQEFQHVAEALKETIGSLSQIEVALENRLRELGTLVESAKTGIPTIEKKVVEIVNEVGNGAKASADIIAKQVTQSTTEQNEAVKRHQEILGRSLSDMNLAMQQQVATIGATMSKSATDLADSMTKQSQANERHLDVLGKQLQSLSESLISQITASTSKMTESVAKQNAEVGRHIQDTGQQLQQVVTSMSQELGRVILRHNETIGNNITELSKKTEQQVLALDAELASALKKSLDSLGQQLGALSTKFVNDYGPLTEKLREVVSIAKRVQP